MRLDCPKCGAKGDSRKTKTPMWRCSPAPSNGGCGYEWDDPNYDAPTIDYKALGYSDMEHYERITGFDARLRDEERARRLRRDEERARRPREEELRRNPPPPPAAPVPPPPPPERTPNADSESPFETVLHIGCFFVIASMLAIIVYGCATTGFPDFMGDDDGYKETCAIEDRGGRIREICW